MESSTLLAGAFGRVRSGLERALRGLSTEQVLYQPDSETNSIAWLAWHLTRVQDHHLSGLADRPQTWVVDGWSNRFGMPPSPGNTGTGHTARQVRSFRSTDVQMLLDYHKAVSERTLQYLTTLTAADLDRVLDEPQYTPIPTVGVRLISLITDNTGHLGLIEYLRGLIEKRHWYPA